MDIHEAIVNRKCFRAFNSRPVPRSVLEKILDEARWSPSYTNTQPWEVAVVSGKKKSDLDKMFLELDAASAARQPDVPSPVAWPLKMQQRAAEHGQRRMKVMGIEPGQGPNREMWLNNLLSYHAPVVVFLLTEKEAPEWSLFDLGCFAQTYCLAAHAQGLETCLQASTIIYPDKVREFLAIPATKKLVLGIATGYPDDSARINTYRSGRIEVAEFTSWYE